VAWEIILVRFVGERSQLGRDAEALGGVVNQA
jgi:hypothetical protein